MADEIMQSEGNLKFRIGAVNAIANYDWATVAELNALQPTEGVFDLANYSPIVQASADEEWTPLDSKFGKTARGASSFGANVTFKHAGRVSDMSNLAAIVWQMVKILNTDLVVVWAVDGELGDPNQPALVDFAHGDFYSIAKVVTDEWSDNITGEEDFDYTINLVGNGHLGTYNVASTATPVLSATLDATYSTPGLQFVKADVNGRDYTHAVRWSSSNPAVATVSEHGIITEVGTGTAVITATLDGIAGISDTVNITVA